LSDEQRSSEKTDAEAASTAIPDAGASGPSGASSVVDRSETFLQAARLAEDRIAEVAAATGALKAENEGFRDRLEAQLSEKYEQRRERLLLSAVQTLEAMDRSIEAARNSDAAESLISGVMLVRTQLFRILQEEGLERLSVLGLPFDRRSAEAVRRRPVTDPDQDGLVIEELQGGHQLRGHVIRRAKVVVGEFSDEVVAPVPAAKPESAPPPAPAEPPPAEAPSAERPPAEPPRAPETQDETPAEEAIVVEDWGEATHPGTPAALLGLPVVPPSPAITSAPPSARDARTDPEEDDNSANTTMVLGESAAVFVRPPAPAPPTHGATAAAPDPVEETQENLEPLTQGIAREALAVPQARPYAAAAGGGGGRPPMRPGGLGPPRVRTGPVPPQRDRSPVYEDPRASRGEPVPVPPPPAPTNPGVTTVPPAGRSRGLAVAAIAGTAILLVAALAWWALGRRPKPAETATTVAEASPVAAAPAQPAATPAIEEDVTVVPPSAPETAKPSLAPPGVAVTETTLTPAGPVAAAPAAHTPPPAVAAPATARPTPPPPAAPVNPVPGLMAQAEQAMASKRYTDAIAKFNDVLKLEPQNQEAATRKLHAQGERASMGRYFLTAVTMSEGKASGGGLKGFDGGSVVKSQCECALTYEVDPTNPAQGERYAVSIFLRNDSKKDIKPQSIAATVTVNGSSSNRPISLATKEVKRGQKTLIGRLDDTWTLGTTSWSMEAAVGAGGNTYRAQLTWELRVPAAQ
jgi:molecular chaperone GrpE (heat shock protein)